jgi:hypothetical protein
MAQDLRDMLKRVLASAGKKKYFFAYGLGKRKDKKGEGELVVRGKKPKKAEIEAVLTDPGDVFEGNCWLGGGAENSQTVYFRSKTKKLSAQIITKMTKTAKTTASNNYDFQMPSPEEEARADNLAEEEGQEGAESVPVAPAGETVPPTPPPTPQTGADVMKRLNALTADIKAALAGPNKAAVQTRFVAVNTLIKNGDYAGANTTLNELEGLVKGPQPMMGEGKAPGTDGKLSIVKLGKARIEWGQLASKAVADIGTMMELIEEEFADYTDQKTELANAKKRVEGLIGDLKDELSPALDNVLNGQDDNQRKPLIERAKGILAKYVKIVQSDPIMTKLDGNEVMPEMKVCAPMQGKLQEIAAALG